MLIIIHNNRTFTPPGFRRAGIFYIVYPFDQAHKLPALLNGRHYIIFQVTVGIGNKSERTAGHFFHTTGGTPGLYNGRFGRTAPVNRYKNSSIDPVRQNLDYMAVFDFHIIGVTHLRCLPRTL